MNTFTVNLFMHNIPVIVKTQSVGSGQRLFNFRTSEVPDPVFHRHSQNISFSVQYNGQTSEVPAGTLISTVDVGGSCEYPDFKRLHAISRYKPYSN
jgi:hypothetical protein